MAHLVTRVVAQYHEVLDNQSGEFPPKYRCWYFRHAITSAAPKWVSVGCTMASYVTVPAKTAEESGPCCNRRAMRTLTEMLVLTARKKCTAQRNWTVNQQQNLELIPVKNNRT